MDEEDEKLTVVGKFLEQVREIHLKQRSEIDLSDKTLFSIANDISLRTELLETLSTYSNDPSFAAAVLFMLQNLCVNARMSGSELETNIKTIDVYGQRVSAGAAIGGAAALLYGPVAMGTIPFVGPVILAVCGLAGLGYCVKGRMELSKVKRDLEAKALKMEDLVQELKESLEKGNE